MLKKIIFIVILLILVYGFIIEPNNIKVTNYKINNPALKGIKIAFVSDFHVKPNEHGKLRKITKIINQQDPDIILSTGGFINGSKEISTMPIEKIAERLAILSLKARFYTVLGENDLLNKDKVQNALKKVSINVISNSGKRILVKGKALNIFGIENKTGLNENLKKMMSKTKEPVILLSHYPDVFKETPENVFLTLSGHTHGGQIVIPPFGALILPKDSDKNYIKGLITEENKKMIITSGLGTSNIHARINCPPEIVIITFE